MNADQVIEGIGKVVAAAKPAQEYCFLGIDWWPMCMTKSEWSGWAQAIGAFMALVFAVALPAIQNRLRRARTYILARDCLLVLTAIYAAIKVNAQRTPDLRSAIRGSKGNVDSLLKRLDEIRADDLSTNCLPLLLSARANAVHLNELPSTLGPDVGVKMSLADWEARAIKLLQEFKDHEPKVLGIRASRIWG